MDKHITLNLTDLEAKEVRVALRDHFISLLKQRDQANLNNHTWLANYISTKIDAVEALRESLDAEIAYCLSVGF
jgi:hypothetical protein